MCCCSVLPCVAVCCSVVYGRSNVLLQCVAVCCSVLQCVAVWFEVDLMCSPSFLIQSDLCILNFHRVIGVFSIFTLERYTPSCVLRKARLSVAVARTRTHARTHIFAAVLVQRVPNQLP